MGPFDLDAPQNDDWEGQIQHVPALFEALAWWRLEPRNELLGCSLARSGEREINGCPAPPLLAYWCLADRGEQYVVYVRGLANRVDVALDAPAQTYAVRQFNPRTGECEDWGLREDISAFAYRPPDEQDWVVLLQRAGEA